MNEKRFWFVIDKGKLEYVQDNVTGEKITVTELEDLLNELAEENEQLKSYIDTIFEGNTHICKKIDIEDVQFYCQRNRDYRFPTCTYAKCFDEENLVEVKEEIRRCSDD